MFSAAGTIGFAIGPIGIAVVVNAFGLEATWYVVGVGLLMSAVLYRTCPPLEPFKQPAGATANGLKGFIEPLIPVLKPLLLLYLITVIRSGMQITTNYYLPFLLDERGYDVRGTGGMLTVFLLMGGLGGLAGGFLAERISGRLVTIYSGVLAGPLLIGAFLTSGPLSILLLGLGGFMLLSTLPVLVAMAQELAPGQTSTVSALMMGAAWGVGALAPSALKSLTASQGYQRVLILASAATMVTAVLAAMLPREKTIRRDRAAELVEGAVGD
jgi:FSR family fosmidomycin resistance protein-like MFS transporter